MPRLPNVMSAREVSFREVLSILQGWLGRPVTISVEGSPTGPENVVWVQGTLKAGRMMLEPHDDDLLGFGVEEAKYMEFEVDGSNFDGADFDGSRLRVYLGQNGAVLLDITVHPHDFFEEEE